jgi:hypothetical protein
MRTGADAIAGAEQKIADLKAQDRGEPGAVDDARIRLRVRRDAYGRTSLRMVRSALESCVRTVSDSGKNILH